MVHAGDWDKPWDLIKESVKERCAIISDNVQHISDCMREEEKGYQAMQGNFGMPESIANKVKESCAGLSKYFRFQASCMRRTDKCQVLEEQNIIIWETPWDTIMECITRRCAGIVNDIQFQPDCMKKEEKGYEAMQGNFEIPDSVALQFKKFCTNQFKNFYEQADCVTGQIRQYYINRTFILEPEIIHHARPNSKSIDMNAFEKIGCKPKENQTDQEWYECPANSVIGGYGCNAIKKVPDLFGGLDVPMVFCFVELKVPNIPDSPDWHKKYDRALKELKDQSVYSFGCRYKTDVRYIVITNGKFLLIKNRNGLKSAIAPIKSPEKALSYVLAATGLSAEFGMMVNPQYVYLAKTLEDTHVITEQDGYSVNLFMNSVCGCGRKATSEIIYKVKPSGDIETISSRQIFLDDDTACVD